MNTTNLIIAGLAFMAGKTLSESGGSSQAPAGAPQAPRAVALDSNLDDTTYRAVVNCFKLARAPEQLEQLAVAVAQFPIASLLLQRRAQEMRAAQSQAVPKATPAAPVAPVASKPHPNADVSLSLLKMLADLSPEIYETQAAGWAPEQRQAIEALMLSKGLNPPKAKPKAEAPKPELPEAKPNGLAQELGSAMPQPVHAALPTEAPKS